jgi:mycothiol synthase
MQQSQPFQAPLSQLIMHLRTLDDLPSLPESPPGYSVRLLNPGEEDALTVILSEAFPEVGWDLERTHRALINAPDVEAIYVATYQDAPVATASVRYLPDKFPDEGMVHWVGALSEHRGKGLGRAVVLRVLHHFREDGYTASALETDDFRLAAIKTYLGLGFKPRYTHPDHESRWQAIMKAITPYHG